MSTGEICTSSQDGSDMVYDFTCTPCTGDGKNSEAFFQCVECKTYYCNICVEGHNRYVKNHTVLDEAAMKSGRGQKQRPTSSSAMLLVDTCDEHHGEVIKMYCGKHDVVCCSVCAALHHKSCSGVEYIPKMDKTQLHFPDEAKGAKTTLENVKTGLQQLKSVKIKFLQDTKKREDDIIKDIRDSKTRLQSRLEELETASVLDVKTKCNKIIDDANGDIDHIDQMLNDVNLRLSRNSTEDDDNDIQSFINTKVMKIQSSKWKADSNEIRRKPLENVEYELRTSTLLCVEYLGFMKVSEQPLTSYVNILNLIKDKRSPFIASSLQAELEENGVSSKFIKLKDLAANFYTVVICDMNTADTTVKNIKEELHSKTLLVPVVDASKYLERRQHMNTVAEELKTNKNLAGLEDIFLPYSKHNKIGEDQIARVVKLVLDVIYEK